MSEIIHVIIYLDDDVPEYISRLIRCGSVISYDENENETDHQELIDNQEFHSEEDLISYIATKLEVDKNIVQIET